MLPWDSEELGASPYVAAFREMGIPAADHIMNAVVLTAVLSCLNSGLYTASRMLFVLAARREAPAQLIKVNNRGVPIRDPRLLRHRLPLRHRGVGLPRHGLPVPAQLVRRDHPVRLSADRLSQIVLRRKTTSELRIKMWLFPVLSILTVAGMLAVLVQMGLDDASRRQLLSLFSWAVVIRSICHQVARRLGRACGGTGADAEPVRGLDACRFSDLRSRRRRR